MSRAKTVDLYVAPPVSSKVPLSDPWSTLVRPAARKWFTEAPPTRLWLLRDNRTSLGSGVLPLGKVGMLIGEGGVSKTMALIAFAIAVATGTTWFGCFDVDVDAQGRVLLLLGEEDPDEVQRRCYNAARASKTNPPPDDSIVAVPLAGVPCSMIETDEHGNAIDAPFLLWLRSYVAANGPFTLILVDPLSRFAGKDAEIDNAAATRFVQALESIAKETGATVIVAHHTNKSSRGNGAAVNGAAARGSSAIFDGVRWAASLSAERIASSDATALPDALAEIVTLATVKSNYSRKGDPVFLRRDGENGGALVPLDEMDLEIVREARAKIIPSARRRAEREAEREQKEAREQEQRAQRAVASEAGEVSRCDDEDRVLDAILSERPDLSQRAIRAAMQEQCARGCGHTRVDRAIERRRTRGGV